MTDRSWNPLREHAADLHPDPVGRRADIVAGEERLIAALATGTVPQINVARAWLAQDYTMAAFDGHAGSVERHAYGRCAAALTVEVATSRDPHQEWSIATAHALRRRRRNVQRCPDLTDLTPDGPLPAP